MEAEWAIKINKILRIRKGDFSASYLLSSGQLDTALEYFQFALEKDPDYALA